MIQTSGPEDKYYYRAYGLLIQSDMILKELIAVEQPLQNEIDVVISCRDIPKKIRDAVLLNENFQISKHQVIFSIEGVGSFYIAYGNQITLELAAECNVEYAKIFLLGSAFGILFLQRNTIAIHSGAIVWNQQAVLFTGNTGVGKSTLTTGLRVKGFNILADDVAVVKKQTNGKYEVHPSFPQQKLCGDSMSKMGFNKESYKQIDPFRDKYAIPIQEHFVYKPVDLGAIFELSVGDVSDIQIQEITGSEKMMIFMKNIYRIEFTEYMGLRKEYFKNCVEMVKNIPVYRMTRPKDGYYIDRQIDLIERTLAN